VYTTLKLVEIDTDIGNNSFCCCLFADVEHFAILLMTGHQIRTIQPATENICIWD